MSESSHLIHLERLGNSQTEEFNQANILYKSSFPLHEQRLPEDQNSVLQHPAYHFDLIYDRDAFIGIVLYWIAERFMYIEHLAIVPNRRGQHYGSAVLEYLCKNSRTVILEIDPPADVVSINRKHFYEKAGFYENPYPHIHPPYQSCYSGHRLVVMSFPDVLTADLYNTFLQFLNTIVMSFAE